MTFYKMIRSQSGKFALGVELANVVSGGVASGTRFRMPPHGNLGNVGGQS